MYISAKSHIVNVAKGGIAAQSPHSHFRSSFLPSTAARHHDPLLLTQLPQSPFLSIFSFTTVLVSGVLFEASEETFGCGHLVFVECCGIPDGRSAVLEDECESMEEGKFTHLQVHQLE